jgi:hypothetical protein
VGDDDSGPLTPDDWDLERILQKWNRNFHRRVPRMRELTFIDTPP